MDRAAFLRSLNFLRPLPPGVWDPNDDEEQYSGSTITPPTPSKNFSTMLFQESVFAVSIEPSIISSDERIDATAESTQQTHSRKRGRDEDSPVPTASQNCLALGPAFFQKYSTDKRKHGNAKNAEAAMEVESEDNGQQDNDDAGEADLKRQINSDSSMCTFEAAIMKKLPSSLLADDPVEDSVFATPNGHRHPTCHERDSMQSKALIFRFGNHFVFQVDESSIVDLKYEPGRDEEIPGKDGSHPNIDGDEKKVESPSPKRQRTGGGGSSRAVKASPKTKRIPPSLLIDFGSCTFRIFSLEGKFDNTAGPNSATPTDRVWSTLAKTVESVESRIMTARTTLMQQFEIESRVKEKGREKRVQIASSSWEMAPPGSGLAFEAWPESFDILSFHSNNLKVKASTFLEEDWSHCMCENETIPSTISSPQKSSSASKTSGSSTRVEHGQKDSTPTKDESHPRKDSDVGKSEGEEKTDAPNHSSELTHESEQHGKDNEEAVEEASLLEDLGKDGKKSESINRDPSEETGEQSHKVGASEPGNEEKTAGRDEFDSEDVNANLLSWKDEMYRKYHHFEKSAIYMERAMHSTTASSKAQQIVTNTSNLTSCVESLSNSYLTANEFMNSTQQCENDIKNVTCEMEKVLEKMFPARVPRGRKSNAVASNQSEDFQSRIEELMTSRKEAVAAKFALLMTPKR